MNYKNLHSVDWVQMQKDIKEDVQEIGYNYIADRPLSTHPADWYLRVVLGNNKRGYATWIYNAELGGLHEGHYDMERDDFLTRE